MGSYYSKNIVTTLLLIIIGSFGFYIYDLLSNPCRLPLSIGINSIDSKFNLKLSEAESALKSSIEVWESNIDYDLFTFASNDPDIAVDFLYDSRQASTEALGELNGQIDTGESDYDRYKRLYEVKNQEYKILEAKYETKIAEIKKSKKQPSRSEITELENLEDQLNGLVDEINVLVNKINALATNVQSKVELYNEINDSLNGSFDQGVYSSDGFKRNISIYQFKNINELRSVLVHELGHTLGLEHNENNKSVMYYLNEEDVIQSILPSDIEALKAKCLI